MKFPCRHILAVLKDYDIRMFSVRWLTKYQRYFDRQGFDEMYNVFRDMELEEFNRNITEGEHIYVGNLLYDERFKRHLSTTYPIALDETTEEEMSECLLLNKLQNSKVPILRGSPIQDQISTSSLQTDNDDSSTSHTCEEAHVCMSQSTMDTQERDALFMKNVKLRELQSSLSDRADDLSNGKHSKYNTLFSMLKDTYNLVSENDHEYQIFVY